MTNQDKTTHEKEILNMNGKELAEWLHIHYERIAKLKGWKTQDNCSVEFDKLPELNKSVMLNLAQSIQINLAHSLLNMRPVSVCEQEKEQLISDMSASSVKLEMETLKRCEQREKEWLNKYGGLVE